MEATVASGVSSAGEALSHNHFDGFSLVGLRPWLMCKHKRRYSISGKFYDTSRLKVEMPA